MILNTILLPLATLCAVDSTTLDQPVIVSDSTTIELSDSLYSEEELHRAEMFDSLLHTLYSNNPAGDFQFYQQDLVEIDTTQALYSEVPDSVWYHRMRNIMSAIELDYNSVVKRYLVAYTTTRKSTVSAVLGRSLYYFPLFEEQLERHGMPLELRMLPVSRNSTS